MRKYKDKEEALDTARDQAVVDWQPDDHSFGDYLHNEKAGIWRLSEARAWFDGGYRNDGICVWMTFRRVKKDGTVDTAKSPITILHKSRTPTPLPFTAYTP